MRNEPPFSVAATDHTGDFYKWVCSRDCWEGSGSGTENREEMFKTASDDGTRSSGMRRVRFDTTGDERSNSGTAPKPPFF